MTRIVAMALLGVCFAQAGQGQEAPMRPFDLWVGRWKGSGWSVSAAGTRTEFTLEERVQRKVGGTVLLVDGRGTTADGTVTHDGLVVLSYDAKSRAYRWQGHEIGRDPINVEVKPIDGGLTWSLPAGGATVRFTIRFDATRWQETGEVSTDGATWNRFMEMTLKRV